MLKLYDEHGRELDEADLYEAANSCGLLLVTGITGSGYRVVAEALAHAAPRMREWDAVLNLKAVGLDLTSSLDPLATYFLGEFRPMAPGNDQMLHVLTKVLASGSQAVACTHALPVMRDGARGGINCDGVLSRMGVKVMKGMDGAAARTRLVDLMVERGGKLVGVQRGEGVSRHVRCANLSELVARDLPTALR